MPIASRKVSKISKSPCDARSGYWTISDAGLPSTSGSPWTKQGNRRQTFVMTYSKHCSENQMHRAARVSLLLVIVSLLISVLAAAKAEAQARSRVASKKEYFTEDELDLIRDAQEL